MPNSRYKLTPQVQRDICAFIRAGGWPHVAAEAAGIPMAVFADWLRQGQLKHPRPRYKQFADDVRQAVAQARLNAEIKAFSEDPIAWLKFGPGKERPDRPGWTTTIKPQLTQDNRQVNLLLDPSMMSLFGSILQILSPWPEARAKLAEALAGKPPPLTVTALPTRPEEK